MQVSVWPEKYTESSLQHSGQSPMKLCKAKPCLREDALRESRSVELQSFYVHGEAQNDVHS